MTDAADPAGSQAVADAWGQLAAGLDEAADLFRQAMLESTVGWTGAAAEGMREQLARVATWSKATAAQYKAAGGAIGEQSAAADSAKRAMPPPVPYDPAQMIRDAAGSGNIADMAGLSFTMYAQKQRHDAAHDQAAEIVTNRDRTFADAAGRVPPFAPPPSLTSDDGDAPVQPMSTPGAGGRPRARVQDSPPAPRRPADQAPAGKAPERPAQETPSAPPSAGPGPAPAPSPPPPAPTPPPTPSPPVPAGTEPNAFVPDAGVTPAGASSPGHGFGASGFGPGGAPRLPVTSASLSGFGPGGSAAPAGRVAPLARPSAGVAGVPVGVRGQGDEDGEHKRPEYLIEPDAESMFGSDAMTSPPVIGEG